MHTIREMRQYLFNRSIMVLENPTRGVEIILPSNKKYQVALVENSWVLDNDILTDLQKEQNYPVGRMNSRHGAQLAMRMACKISDRLAKQFSPDDPAEAKALATAWHFTIWTELCHLLPLRKLVNHIVRKANGRRILLPFDPARTDCFCWWGKNQVEPFLLAHELIKRGQNVFLLAPWGYYDQFKGNNESLDVHFFSSPAFWEAPGSARIPNLAVTKVFSPDHVRHSDYVQRCIGAEMILGNSLEPCPYDDFLLRDREHYSAPLIFRFNLNRKTRGFSTLRPEQPLPGLEEGFLSLMGSLSRSTWKNALKAVQQNNIKEVHVCDLLMFDSALVAHAVSDTGGKVHLWPHSTNAIVLPYHQNIQIANVTVITRTSQRQWEAQLHEGGVQLASQIMLNRPMVFRPFDPSEMINVVFFAGTGRCGRMPALDYSAHEVTMRKLFKELQALPKNYRLFVKEKHIWETQTWLEKFTFNDGRFIFTNKTTSSLNFPNMLYVTASMGSSALLEGMCKGIPGFIARETVVSDYTPLSEARQQVGSVGFVIRQLNACGDGDYYTKLANRNLEWMRTETDFPNWNPKAMV